MLQKTGGTGQNISMLSGHFSYQQSLNLQKKICKIYLFYDECTTLIFFPFSDDFEMSQGRPNENENFKSWKSPSQTNTRMPNRFRKKT